MTKREPNDLSCLSCTGFHVVLLLVAMCDSTRDFCRSSRDSTIGINFDALGDVEHFEHLSGDFYDFYKARERTDVTFVVSGVRFPAHRIILAARCTFFNVLLFGDMKEAKLGPGAEIPFDDTTPEAFGALLEYIYSGKLCLGDLSEDVSMLVIDPVISVESGRFHSFVYETNSLTIKNIICGLPVVFVFILVASYLCQLRCV